MNSDNSRILIVNFWKWFKQNEFIYRSIINDNKTDLIDDILNKLIEIQKGLAVEFEESNGIYVMTISADGVEDNFDIVQKIIADAPQIKDWELVAFRQPYAKHKLDKIVITVYGHTLDPKQIMFLPVIEDGKIYIQIFSSEINEENRNKIGYGCLILLDSIIGEYACVKKINGFEYYNMKEATDFESELRPLIEIREYLDLYYQQKNN
jgi:hypothetical protein